MHIKLLHMKLFQQMMTCQCHIYCPNLKQLQIMKQQVNVEQVQSSDTHPTSRKQKLQKKRIIRKNKTQVLPCDLSQLRKIDTSNLSRQQKARIQKAKNRQAAQKSRDSHKEYVTNLEKEIKQLREKVLVSRKICWKCQRELQESQNHQSSLSDQQTDERSKCEKVFSFEKDDEPHFREESNLQHFHHFEQESFMRAQDSSDQNSYMKMMLFVCMVVLAAFFIGSAKPEVNSLSSSRALMEIPQMPKTPQIINIQKSQENLNITNKLQTAIVPVQKGLIALNTDDCLNSLMRVETIQIDPKKSLRTYHDSQPSPNYLASQQGILLCTVRTSKSYESRFQKLRSPLVKLYLLGSEIKQMLTHSNLLMPIRDSNIQLNGLYRVAAQIKDVNLVNDHNCLL